MTKDPGNDLYKLKLKTTDMLDNGNRYLLKNDNDNDRALDNEEF